MKRIKQPTVEQLQRTVDLFNRAYKEGDEVLYYAIVRNSQPQGEPQRLKIVGEAWILGDHSVVVYLKGAGNVAVDHCYPVKE
jgi:hypothetical protein